MSDLDLTVNIQGGSQIAAHFLGFGGALASSMHGAMEDIVSILTPAAQGNMHWKAPTGALEASISEDSQVIDAWHAEIGSSLPYAARRNWGFSGTDSLGRQYNDQGAYFLDNALTDHTMDIEDRIHYAVQASLFGA